MFAEMEKLSNKIGDFREKSKLDVQLSKHQQQLHQMVGSSGINDPQKPAEEETKPEEAKPKPESEA